MTVSVCMLEKIDVFECVCVKSSILGEPSE